MKHIIPLAFFFAVLVGCSDDCPNCGTPPEMINFAFLQESDGQDLLYSEEFDLDSLNIFYEDKGRTERLNCNVFTDEDEQRMYLQSGDVGFLSHRGVHNFTIMHKGVSLGTLDVLFMQKSDKERCCTWYAAESIYHNNLPVELTKNEKLDGTVIELFF